MYAVIIVAVFLVSFLYTYYRGKERLKASRQLFDHSTFLAPVNMFMTGFSKLPNQPFFDVAQFPELKPLQDNWQVIREEAIQLQNQIKASEKNNDAGFNTFLNAVGNAFI
jgi:beta-hydroxylase